MKSKKPAINKQSNAKGWTFYFDTAESPNVMQITEKVTVAVATAEIKCPHSTSKRLIVAQVIMFPGKDKNGAYLMATLTDHDLAKKTRTAQVCPVALWIVDTLRKMLSSKKLPRASK